MWIKRFQCWLTFVKAPGPNHRVVSDVSAAKCHRAPFTVVVRPQRIFSLINCFPSQICFYFLGFAFQRNPSTKAGQEKKKNSDESTSLRQLFLCLFHFQQHLIQIFFLVARFYARANIHRLMWSSPWLFAFPSRVFPLSARSGLFDFFIRYTTSFKSH